MDLIPEEAFEGMAKLWAIRPPQDPDIVRVMVGGKPQFYRVNEPYLLRALTSFVPFDFPGLSVARLAKRVLTSMVTATPDFMLRNFVRDTMATKMIDRGELGAGVRLSDSIKGMGKAYMESGAGETMLFAGASFQGGHINGADPADTGRSIRRALRAKGFKASSVDEFMSSVLDTPVRFFEKYREIGDAVENANREAIFESVTRAGGSETAAAFQSKDLMDFSLRGSWAAYNFFADVVPFLNPRVQGLYRLGRANPKRVATYGLTMAAFAVLYAMAHAGDDRYERLPDWEKDGFWHFWVGGQHLRVPKPFELGLIFSTIPERMTRLMIGQDSAKKFAARMWAGTTDTLAFDPTPQLIKPAIEAFVSKRNSFFDTPIENDRDKGLPASVRADARTSDTMRVAVKAANVQLPILDKGAMDAMDISPKKMEHLVRGYLGTVGLYALGMVDSAVRMIEGHPPRPQLRMDEYPVVGVFMRVDPPKATVFQSDLYRIKEEVDKVQYTKMLKDANGDRAKIEESRRFLAQNAAAINARPALVRGAEELGKLRKERDSIYLDPAMAPAAKRDRLDQVYQRQADVAQTIMLMPQVKAIR